MPPHTSRGSGWITFDPRQPHTTHVSVCNCYISLSALLIIKLGSLEVIEMENVSWSMELPVSGLQMRAVGYASNDPRSQHFSGPSEQISVVDSIPCNPIFNTSAAAGSEVQHYESSGVGMGLSPIWMSSQLVNEDVAVMNGFTGHNTSLPAKRKAEMESNLYTFNSGQPMFANKHPMHLGRDLGSSEMLLATPPQRTGPVPPNPAFPSSNYQSNKMQRGDSFSGKSAQQRGQPAKKQSTQNISASKVKQESSESVRSKMRQSLAAALALALKSYVSDAKKDEREATVGRKIPAESCASGLGATRDSKSSPKEAFPENESTVVATPGDSLVLLTEHPANGNRLNGESTFQEFQYTSVLGDEDVQFSDSFFIKDDLLQGNGLSWALDFDMQMREAQNGCNPNSVTDEVNGQRDEVSVANLTPDDLALKIEAELFKLFDGVNKKYKEKGRSLLFNLKDRNNPDLRDRVMSGDIPPERLCSMSAEDLASRELSEWRLAKAEELAQMKVLPDTEVDIRRLVRKTHKGEYQVEVEHDDSIVNDLSGGTSILSQPKPKKDTEIPSPSKLSLKAGEDVQYENQDTLSTLVIPADGADLMQGMMVDDLKDSQILPPIVSLDEFMESLNDEPPFKDLSADADQKFPDSREASKTASKSSRAVDSPKDAPSKEADAVKTSAVVTRTKRSSGSPEQKVSPGSAEGLDYLWEGTLQFSLSSSITVGGLYHSGEKTSMKLWPSSLEIKGRVRLGAFEKFLQDLPMSRTRAVMVLKLELKDKASKSQISNFSEAVESYAADERLGYAEPTPGVEIYLCPPTPRVTEIVKQHLSKETHDSMENGLIGVVVWRRVKTSKVISPNSTHSSSKKQSVTTTHHNRVQDSSNVNVNSSTPRSSIARPSVLNNVSHSIPLPPQPEEDDDIPPGFGPPAGKGVAKDEDDLPEFNFSGQISSTSLRRISPQNQPAMGRSSVDKVRELIQKYGQSGTIDNKAVGFEPWEDDDDDDDIPEWQPEAPVPLPYPGIPAAQLVNPMALDHSVTGLPPPSPGGRWVPPPRSQHDGRWRPY